MVTPPMSPKEDRSFEVGDRVWLAGMPDIARLNGNKAKLIKSLGKDRWVVMVDGEVHSRMVTAQNLQMIEPSLCKYSIAGTWDNWEPHEMTWDMQMGCFEYPVVLSGWGNESFIILCDNDWDKCVCPDQHDANPHVNHRINGPDDSRGDFEWTIGHHHNDQSFKGACYKVQMFVSTDGMPKKMFWELATQ